MYAFSWGLLLVNVGWTSSSNNSWQTASVDSVLSTKFAKEYTHLKENINEKKNQISRLGQNL